MENRVELSTLEYKEVWDRIYDDFNFEPSISNFPSFDVPKPFITYDVSSYINWSGDIDTYNEHPGYWINPHLEFSKSEFDGWTVPIFPNGDYYFFIHKMLNGDYWDTPGKEPSLFLEKK